MPRLKTMMNLSALLGVSALARDAFKTRFLQRMMKDVASLIALAVATGFMAGALLIGLFYLAYQELVRNGLQPLPAVLLLMGVGVLAIYGLVILALKRLERLRRTPGRAFSRNQAVGRAVLLVGSFMDGFKHPYKPPPAGRARRW